MTMCSDASTDRTKVEVVTTADVPVAFGSESEMSSWIACAQCHKWRRIELAQLATIKSPSEWICAYGTDPLRNSCDVAEEDNKLGELVHDAEHAEWVSLSASASGIPSINFDDEPPQVVLLVATAIELTGEITAAGIRSSAGALSNCVGCFLHVFKQRVTPMSQPATIPRTAGTVVEGARCVASAALGITSCVGESVAAAAAAERVAVVSRQGVTSAAVRTLGTASLSALTEVYEAADISTRQLASSSAVAASDAISHRYGGGAGKVTHDAFAAFGSAAQAALHLSAFGRKGLAKTAAKSAAKAVVAAAVDGQGQDERGAAVVEGRPLSRAETEARFDKPEAEGWVRLDRAWDLGDEIEAVEESGARPGLGARWCF